VGDLLLNLTEEVHELTVERAKQRGPSVPCRADLPEDGGDTLVIRCFDDGGDVVRTYSTVVFQKARSMLTCDLCTLVGPLNSGANGTDAPWSVQFTRAM
jgi:hypothetical protein